jgi:ABC-type lipoprotein release transport system permease subunit
MSLDVGNGQRLVEVVGLTENSRSVLYRTPEPVVFMPLPARYSSSVTLLVRSGSPDQTVRGVRELVRRMDPHLPVHSIETARELRTRQLLPLRLLALALATMGTIAVALAVVGLYGVMAFSVTRRTREIGVRLAFGARRGQVLTLVLGEAVRLVAVGVLLGGAIAAGLALLMRSLLFGVSPVDPITYGSLGALFLGVGALAALFPALRAASVEPVRAIGE